MNKTLDSAFVKATLLPESAQERLGRELLAKMDGHAALRAEIDLGFADLDAGRSGPLDVEALIKELRAGKGRD